MKVVEDFKSIIRNISKIDEVVLVYDRDGDGVTAMACAKIALLRNGLESKAIPFGRANIEEFTSELTNLRPNLVIFFDVSAEQYPEIFDALPKVQFIVIDHHKRYGRPKNILVIKPNDLGYKKDPSSYATAKMSYDLFSKISDISDLDWVSSIGIISDSVYTYWKSFVNKAIKSKGWKVKKDIFSSELGKIAAIINASNAIRESRITEAAKLILTLNPSKIFKSDLADLSSNIWKEVRELASKFEEKGEVHFSKNLILLEIKSKYKIAGFVSNLVSRENPNSVCVIMEPKEGWVKISGRCQTGGVPVNEVLEKVTKDLKDAKAGGHKPAAGAIVQYKDYIRFKKALISEVGKYFK